MAWWHQFPVPLRHLAGVRLLDNIPLVLGASS